MLAPDRWLRVRSLLEEVIDRPEGERRAFLAEACRDAPDVRAEVESLLRAHSNAGSFLQPPAAPRTEPALDEPAAALLPAGTRLGPFELTALLGTGGMGQVYRALDTRLDRHVAVKVLSPSLAAQSRSRGWLEHEARSISRLAHPHICVLHDVGVARLDDGTERGFLVMELVEGETLARRLTRGALPAGEAVTCATQIAEALAAAHTLGIVHGDVKPSNIVLSRTGVKLLDFGLARLRQPESRDGVALAALKHSPVAGIAGTLPYMAPEVLQGREADERSDIHAFGVVLYEMLSGRRPYAAPSAPELVALIVEGAPPPLPETRIVPDALARIIRTCLAKDPSERWQHAHDVALALETIGQQEGRGPHARGARPRPRSVVWTAAGLALALVTGALLFSGERATPGVAVPHRLTFDAAPLRKGEIWSPSISPNGRIVAFTAGPDGGSEFYLGHLDTGETKLLAAPSAMGCTWSTSWSADGRSLLFASTGQLMAFNVADGSVRVVARRTSGVSTLRAGVSANGAGIVLVGGTQLTKLSGNHDAPAPLYPMNPRVTLQAFPSFLPNGRDFVFTQAATEQALRGVFLGTLDSDEIVRLLPDFTNAAVSPSGHLLFARDGSILAQSLDGRPPRLTGDARVLVSSVLSVGGYTHFAQGRGQTLAYVPDSGATAGDLVWYDRKGARIGRLGSGEAYRQIALTPDGRRVVAERGKHTRDAGGSNLVLLDVVRETTLAANLAMAGQSGDTFGGDFDPVWSPDGRRIAFSAWMDNQADLFVADVDSTEPARRLASLPLMEWAEQWTADGRFLLFAQTDSATKNSLWALPLEGEPTPFVLVDTPYLNDEPQLSPDGRWLAYVSNESGREDVYVRLFADLGRRWRVSTTGGGQPKWRGDGRELFYLTLDGTLMSVDFPKDREPVTPRALFDVPIENPSPNIDEYAVTADGQRFLVISRPVASEPARLAIITNWPALLDD